MKNVMGIINLVNEPDQLEQLTNHRNIASVPFAGRYRLIDFVLSSMVNSGITNVGIFTHTKYRSLMDHLGSGKEWDLDRKRSGLFILPPMKEGWISPMGDLHAIHAHRDYLHRSSEEYVLLSRSYMVCNIDFNGLQEFHNRNQADITVVYKEMSDLDSISMQIGMDENSRVRSIWEPNAVPHGNKVSMEMYFLKKSLLIDIIETSLAEGHYNLMKDAIRANISRLNIFGYAYQGYLGIINTINSYYKHSMNLLNPSVWKDLFFKPGLIYTKIKDEPSTRYINNGHTSNSLVANGCVIEGIVENSILFRGVRIRKGATVRNSIVMQNGVIHENSSIVSVIIDKDVIIKEARTLVGHEKAPYIVVKRKII
ncbi:glucose-1-phosphate adenylyltransferase subunit GlgD [Paenibacillus crassostreae]|uniref:Glucose-1-phosphate adenylyltransferase n=1 Tax=Paenibacillus crassostreae TaxID=1763538 RepID=A0A167G2D9_9BACL|nr:glucose-1-phosphate adenylyltransferase subunit GlgD [Paenibacillus crassostreae]AOZ93828.1 glucose-1-phosphate adenylyltransferase subunit GlgD [Paenibacillus crassostreae]OAB77139.1 glucose-1-phosphate adenylyltransferase [Paenibacillus crassostreae]